MRDHLLFAVLPYVGGLVFIAGSVLPLAFRRGHLLDVPLDVPTTSRGSFGAVVRWAFVVVAVGHVLTLGFPDVTLHWDGTFLRLLLLEGTRTVAGALAAAGAVAVLARLLRSGEGSATPAIDVVAATLLVTATVSGLAVAIVYRWASAWSAVTLAPYLRSLAHFDPSTELVTHLPVLVKLHVVSAIGLVMLVPFTRPARAMARRLTRGRRAQA